MFYLRSYYNKWLILFIISLMFVMLGKPVNAGMVMEPNYFGGHIHRAIPNSLWQKVGFGSIRLHDANVAWLDLEPRQGEFNWTKLDQIVGRVRSAGADILLPLQATPEWAALDATKKGAYGRGANSMPANLSDWDNYVRQVVSRYKGVIAAYEIWNEPNLKQFFDGTPEQLAELTKRAANIIHSTDPKAKVVCSGITESHGIPWFQKYLRAGAGSSCEIIAYHFYLGHQAPEKMLPVIASVRKVMIQEGVGNKPLWNTESGWLIAGSSKTDATIVGFDRNAKVLNNVEASSYVIRSLLLARSAGVERFYWYAWDNTAMGLSDEGGLSWKNSGRVFAEMIRYHAGTSIESCKETAQAWQCKMVMKNGRKADVYWTENASKKINVEQEGELWAPDINGFFKLVNMIDKGGVLEISEAPVFLIHPL